MADKKIVPKASIGSDSKKDLDRKSFISWLSVGWLAFAGATGGFFTILIRFLFPNVLFEPPQSFKIGFPDDFAVGKEDTRFKKKKNTLKNSIHKGTTLPKESDPFLETSLDD